jgi:hypothetical protein
MTNQKAACAYVHETKLSRHPRCPPQCISIKCLITAFPSNPGAAADLKDLSTKENTKRYRHGKSGLTASRGRACGPFVGRLHSLVLLVAVEYSPTRPKPCLHRMTRTRRFRAQFIRAGIMGQETLAENSRRTAGYPPCVDT